MTIESDDYVLPYMNITTLTINMDWGSRINLTYEFNDTNDPFRTEYDRLYPNFKTHVWNVEGTFYPTVSFWTIRLKCSLYLEYQPLNYAAT